MRSVFAQSSRRFGVRRHSYGALNDGSMPMGQRRTPAEYIALTMPTSPWSPAPGSVAARRGLDGGRCVDLPNIRLFEEPRRLFTCAAGYSWKPDPPVILSAAGGTGGGAGGGAYRPQLSARCRKRTVYDSSSDAVPAWLHATARCASCPVGPALQIWSLPPSTRLCRFAHLISPCGDPQCRNNIGRHRRKAMLAA